MAVGLVALVAVELVVLLLAFGIADDPVVPGDGPLYAALGHNLADHGTFSATTPPVDAEVFRTPGYPAVLAMLYRLGGGSEAVVRAAQVLLVGAIAIATGRVARRLFGARTATVAAVVSVVYVPLMLFSVLHLTEVLATLLLTACVAAALEGRSRPTGTARWWTAATVAAAALTIVRPSALVAFAVVPLAVLDRRSDPLGRRLAVAAAVTAGFVLLLAPWALRNHAVAGRLLPLGAGSGTSLYASAEQYAGHSPHHLGAEDFDRLYRHIGLRVEKAQAQVGSARPTDPEVVVAMDDLLRDDARRQMGDLGVAPMVGTLPGRLAALWSPGAITVPLPERLRGPTEALARVEHAGLLLLAAAGAVAYRRRWRELWPLAAPALLLTLVHLVFHVEPRYSLPARPLLFVLAAAAGVAAADRARGSWRERSRPSGA